MARQALQGLYVQISNVADPVAQANFQRISTWSSSVSPLMYQVDDPIVGILPIPNTPQDAYVMATGSPTLDFSGGHGVYTFGQPFPNGILSAVANIVSVGAAESSLEIENTTTTAELHVYGTYSGSPISGDFQISFIVVGW